MKVVLCLMPLLASASSVNEERVPPLFRELHRSAKQIYPKKRSETAKTQKATIHDFRQAQPA